MKRLTMDDLNKMTGKKAIMSKKREIDGIMFDSLAESRRYLLLRAQERAGKIFNLDTHPKYRLEVNDVLIGTYTADFMYHDENANLIVEDVKPNPKTKKSKEYLRGTTNWVRFRILRKLMKAIYDIDVQVVHA